MTYPLRPDVDRKHLAFDQSQWPLNDYKGVFCRGGNTIIPGARQQGLYVSLIGRKECIIKLLPVTVLARFCTHIALEFHTTVPDFPLILQKRLVQQQGITG